MKAAVLIENNKIVTKEIPCPEPGPDEVLVKVSVAGICGSDFSLYHGKLEVPLPIIAGHEAVGTIEKTGEKVSEFKIGERVTVQPNFSCGVCPLCLKGRKNICGKKIRLGIDKNGVFADFVTLPANSLVRIPESLSDELAVYAEPLSVAVHATKMVQPETGNRVLVYGAGVIGLLIVQLERLRGADVTACDLEDSRLRLAKDLGASHTISANGSIESYKNHFDIIYETSGATNALSQAVELAAPAGRIVLLGLPSQTYPLSFNGIVRKELQIKGSIIYVNEFEESLDHLLKGHIQTDLLTTGKFSLNQIDTVLANFSSPNRVKSLVFING